MVLYGMYGIVWYRMIRGYGLASVSTQARVIICLGILLCDRKGELASNFTRILGSV